MVLYAGSSPVLNFILSIIGLIYRIISVLSGLKKGKKSYLWLSGFGRFIKSPTLNIIYGLILIVVFTYAIGRYAKML